MYSTQWVLQSFMSQSEDHLVWTAETPDSNDAKPHPPKLHRALSVDAYFRSQGGSLSSTDRGIPVNQAPVRDEQELTERQLRELYDNEEIERFLHLFTTYVTEVQAPETPDDKKTSFEDDTEEAEYQLNEDVDGVPLRTSREFRQEARRYESMSEEIAYRYVVPMLPPARPFSPFTFSRLRLAMERLYLVIIPVYGPFFKRLYHLASWKDPGKSAIYCSIFWALWWFDMILAALTARILYSLLKHRLFPYPSLEDLRQHREQILNANEFGEQIYAGLSSKASSMKELWRLFKLLDYANKSKLKGTTNKTSTDKGRTSIDTVNVEDQATQENAETKQVQDLKQFGLRLLEELADLHERIHNIFIWRNAPASQRYGTILSILFLLSFLPTRYLVKGMTFVFGFIFWHVSPVILALPRSERRRIPPLFSNVPTDAEYAMQLISQRIVSGLDITPTRKHKRSETSDSPETSSKKKETPISRSSSIDWKKWGDRIAMGKSAIDDIQRLKPGQPWHVHEVWPPRHPLIAGAIGIAQPQSLSEIHTYPCQLGSTPGILTMNHNALLFTPIMSRAPKLVIPLAAVKGVKKAGLLKGLNIRWNESVDGLKEQKEERFVWVGSRDDLFARLVGSDGKRWMKV